MNHEKYLIHLCSYYSVAYADVDKKLNKEDFINLLHQTRIHNLDISILTTRKGYHLIFNKRKRKDGLKESMSGFEILEILLRIEADQLYIERWLQNGTFTLFVVRRGVHNETPFGTVIDGKFKFLAKDLDRWKLSSEEVARCLKTQTKNAEK